MKKLILALVCVILCLARSASAQTVSMTSTNATTAAGATNSLPTIPGALGDLLTALETSGLDTATNLAVEPYLTYAPNAPKDDHFGGGVFLGYNISQFVGAGLGVDYLGQFSLVSANLQLKLPTHPFKNLTVFNGALTNVAFCPMVIGGLAKGLSGGASGAIAVTDAGAYVGFGHLWGGQFNLGAAYGRWDNAGAFSGPRYHFFVGWSKGF